MTTDEVTRSHSTSNVVQGGDAGHLTYPGVPVHRLTEILTEQSGTTLARKDKKA